ncbi:hypothetical protein ElyMa_006289100, partial [Elysia marginata]
GGAVAIISALDRPDFYKGLLFIAPVTITDPDLVGPCELDSSGISRDPDVVSPNSVVDNSIQVSAECVNCFNAECDNCFNAECDNCFNAECVNQLHTIDFCLKAIKPRWMSARSTEIFDKVS